MHFHQFRVYALCGRGFPPRIRASPKLYARDFAHHCFVPWRTTLSHCRVYWVRSHRVSTPRTMLTWRVLFHHRTEFTA